VNAVLLNSSVPVITIICAWLIDRQGATWRQIVGMILSFAGIVVIVSRGEPARLLDLEFHRGDAWIMLAMPCWGLYSVLLKRRPKGLDGFPLVWLLATLGTLMTVPLVIGETLLDRAPRLTWGSAGTVLYLGIFASIVGYWCWNGGVVAVGASNAGFTVHLLPAFGTVLAIVFLDETVHAFHAVGLVTIIAGVVAATAPQLGSSGGRTARNIPSSSKS
jgi:drug/metabolite transporter (DMT)-like permease